MSEDIAVDLAPLGKEGDVCAACGTPLAIDQRYCLNCGEARAEPRMDYTQVLTAVNPAVAAQPAAPGAVPAVAVAQPGGTGPMADPTVRNLIFGVAAVSLLGVMLLLGVLIGKDDAPQTVAAAPTTTTTAETAPTDTTADAAAKDAGKKDKGAGGKAAKTAGGGVQGGSGSTEGISTNNPLEGLTGDALVEAQKNSPDVVATGGEAEAIDPGPAGGGSDATCIGC